MEQLIEPGYQPVRPDAWDLAGTRQSWLRLADSIQSHEDATVPVLLSYIMLHQKRTN